MRNKTKTLFIGGAFACIGSLSGHGETFREKLDAYFKEHAQEIQKSIQVWDDYNLHKQECRITEQELKDVVMRSYKKTIDWMKLSMQHQIRFFDYCRMHLCEGDTASLKKRFDGEQIRIHALRELGDMIDKFTAKKIVFNKLADASYPSTWGYVEQHIDTLSRDEWESIAVTPILIRYKNACAAWNPNSQEPSELRKHLESTVKTRKDFFDDLTGASYFQARFRHEESALYDEKTRYSIERMSDFFYGVLGNSPYVFNWADEKTAQEEIFWMFQRGYVTWSKWNPDGYWTSYYNDGPCVTYQYPEYCLSENYGTEGLVDDLFKDDDLVKAYCKTALLLRECINDACRLYRIYMGTLADLSAVRKGKLKKPQDWYGKILKRCETLFTYWEWHHFTPTIAVADSRNDFETVANASRKIRDCLQKLRNKVRDSITQ